MWIGSDLGFLRDAKLPKRGRKVNNPIGTNAIGPSEEGVPPNPGTVIYAVSSDFKEYWLTMTTLRNPVGGPVALEHIGGQFDWAPIWVMHRKHRNPGEGYYPFIE